MNDQDLQEYEALLRQGTANQGLARAMEQQKKQAEMLRQGTPQGQMVSGHYVAPSWTQNLASIFGNYQSGKASEKALGTGKEMDANTAAQNAAVLRMLMNRQPQQMPPPQQGLPPQQPPQSGMNSGQEMPWM